MYQLTSNVLYILYKSRGVTYSELDALVRCRDPLCFSHAFHSCMDNAQVDANVACNNASTITEERRDNPCSDTN
jgi:hypothetical protein